MIKRDPTTWMWAEACQLLEQAERMHRQFFRPAASGSRAMWEPPIDVFEDEERFVILVALPGVPPECIDVIVEDDTLAIRAKCELPFPASSFVVQRLEIPHGYFERRIELPDQRLRLDPPRSVNGYLELNLRKLS